MQLFYAPQLADNMFFLDEEESRHCIKVLRKQQGNTIDCIDGKGRFYTCEITEANHKKCGLKVINIKEETPSSYQLHISIAPTKNIDRIEWFVEKAVEIGIQEISFIKCQNSERTQIKIDRVLKKAISAMKQSIKASLPQINEMITFNEFMKVEATKSSQKLIAYVDFSNPKQLKDSIEQQSLCILIGPEGDFSPEEIVTAKKNGYLPIGLGNSRLRTETAGIVAVHTVNLLNY